MMYRSPKLPSNQPVHFTPQTSGAIGARGYQPLYHLDIENRCPGCGRSHWYVGRSTAECAYCETALPLALVASQPMQPRYTSHFSATAARGRAH